MNKGRGFQNGWWLVVITIGVMFASGASSIFTNSQSLETLYMILGELVLIVPIIIGFFMINNEKPNDGISEAIGLRSFSPVLLPFILLLPIAAQSFAGFIAMPIQSVLTLLLGTPDYTFIGGAADFWQNFVILCVLAPIFEELLCRGVLMVLFRRYGTARMLVWSSLAFAMLHLGAESIISLFLLGLLLGVIRITTGSVIAAMAAHSASNLYSLIMLSTPEMSPAMQMIFVLVTAAAFPLLLRLYLRRADSSGVWKNTVYDGNAKTGFSSGLAVMTAIFVIYNLGVFVSRLIGGDIFYDINSMLLY